MPTLEEFVVPARRTLGPIKSARASMSAGELWRATIVSSRYGVYTMTGRVRGVGSDLHIGGFNLGSPTSAPSELHGLTRLDEPYESWRQPATEGWATIAHGDVVRADISYNPDDVVAVAGLALEHSERGHLIVGGWHLENPGVRSTTLLARSGEHDLAVPASLTELRTE